MPGGPGTAEPAAPRNAPTSAAQRAPVFLSVFTNLLENSEENLRQAGLLLSTGAALPAPAGLPLPRRRPKPGRFPQRRPHSTARRLLATARRRGGEGGRRTGEGGSPSEGRPGRPEKPGRPEDGERDPPPREGARAGQGGGGSATWIRFLCLRRSAMLSPSAPPVTWAGAWGGGAVAAASREAAGTGEGAGRPRPLSSSPHLETEGPPASASHCARPRRGGGQPASAPQPALAPQPHSGPGGRGAARLSSSARLGASAPHRARRWRGLSPPRRPALASPQPSRRAVPLRERRVWWATPTPVQRHGCPPASRLGPPWGSATAVWLMRNSPTGRWQPLLLLCPGFTLPCSGPRV